MNNQPKWCWTRGEMFRVDRSITTVIWMMVKMDMISQRTYDRAITCDTNLLEIEEEDEY